MPHLDLDALDPVASRFLDGARLTPAEHAEVLRMAQGFACKDSAAAANVSPDTIRARRKRIYRKLQVDGVRDLISELLAVSLELLARREPLGPRPPIDGATPAPGIDPGIPFDRSTDMPDRLPGSTPPLSPTSAAPPP